MDESNNVVINGKTYSCHYKLGNQCAYWHNKGRLTKCSLDTPFCNPNAFPRTGDYRVRGGLYKEGKS